MTAMAFSRTLKASELKNSRVSSHYPTERSSMVEELRYLFHYQV
jgi:hypothetical protein